MEVAGAGVSETYAVVFRSPNGGASTSIGSLTTDTSGDGSLRDKTFFAFGKVGAGNIVLTRSGDRVCHRIRSAGRFDDHAPGVCGAGL